VRSWGTVVGYLSGNTIYGIDFHHGLALNTFNSLPSDLKVMGLSSVMQGFISSASATSATIEWVSDVDDFIWTRPVDENQVGYRYAVRTVMQ
jgi:hypothetical protein